MTHSLHVIFGVSGHGTKIPSDTRYFSNYFAIRETKKGSSPWELGSGRVSLATKCMTVVRPGGNFRAATKKWVIKMCQMIIHQPYFQVSTFVSMWKGVLIGRRWRYYAGKALPPRVTLPCRKRPWKMRRSMLGQLTLSSSHPATEHRNKGII